MLKRSRCFALTLSVGLVLLGAQAQATSWEGRYDIHTIPAPNAEPAPPFACPGEAQGFARAWQTRADFRVDVLQNDGKQVQYGNCEIDEAEDALSCRARYRYDDTSDVVIDLHVVPASDFNGFVGQAVQTLQMRGGAVQLVGSCRYEIEARRIDGGNVDR